MDYSIVNDDWRQQLRCRIADALRPERVGNDFVVPQWSKQFGGIGVQIIKRYRETLRELHELTMLTEAIEVERMVQAASFSPSPLSVPDRGDSGYRPVRDSYTFTRKRAERLKEWQDDLERREKELDEREERLNRLERQMSESKRARARASENVVAAERNARLWPATDCLPNPRILRKLSLLDSSSRTTTSRSRSAAVCST